MGEMLFGIIFIAGGIGLALQAAWMIRNVEQSRQFSRDAEESLQRRVDRIPGKSGRRWYRVYWGGSYQRAFWQTRRGVITQAFIGLGLAVLFLVLGLILIFASS